MSLIAITRVGICASDEGSLVSKSLLLSRFNISVFFRKCTVAWLINQNSSKQQESLFPEIKQSHVSNLTNTFKGMAIVCAADDLELSFSGETGQIEIFDNFVSTDPQQFIHNQMEFSNGKNSLNTAHFPTFEKSLSSELGSSYHSSHFGMEDYSPNSVSSANSQTVRFPYDHSQHNRNQPERSFVNINNNALPEFGFDFMANHQSHYDMMATGVDMSTQFTDFKHGSFNDALSCGSSIDSFESPLDEMFFPVPPFRSNVNSSGVTASSNPRKRKIESPIAPDFGFPSPGAVFKKTSPPYEAQKRIKSESFSHFPAVRPPPQERTKSHPEIFYEQQNMAMPQMSQESKECKEIKTEDEEKGKGRYSCTECSASFRVKSYLTRHIRKHNNAKAFVCPFYKEQDSDYCETGKAGTKCHPTGGFSRKDTYKTHLKALHFIYPPRTKSSERGSQGGRCAGCFKYFESNADWFKYHIEEGACKGFVNKACIQVKQESQD